MGSTCTLSLLKSDPTEASIRPETVIEGCDEIRGFSPGRMVAEPESDIANWPMARVVFAIASKHTSENFLIG